MFLVSQAFDRPRDWKLSPVCLQDNVWVHGRDWVPVDVAGQYSDDSDDDTDSRSRSDGAQWSSHARAWTATQETM